jgi:hypothetical protein
VGKSVVLYGAPDCGCYRGELVVGEVIVGMARDIIGRRVPSDSAWLRPRIAPLAIMVAAVAGALSGRVFRLPGRIMPPARTSRWRIVDRRALKEAGRIVGVRPCGRGEDKGDKARGAKMLTC